MSFEFPAKSPRTTSTCVNRLSGHQRTLMRAAVVILLGLLLVPISAADAQQPKDRSMPPWKSVDGFVQRYFASVPGYQKGDLISRGRVEATLKHLKKMGWIVSDRVAILNATLEDRNVLVQQFQSTQGRKYMRQVKGYPLAFSQLDRVSRQYGGRALVRDIVKLPDGAKYASPNRARGVPNLVDLLPKRGGSKAQRIADYDKPTGRIYTVKELLKRLKASYDIDAKKLAVD